MKDDRKYGPSAVADALMASTRRLMLAATTATLSDEQLMREAKCLDEISARLETGRASRMRRVRFTEDLREELRSGTPWRMLPYNPLSIPQSIEVKDGEARSRIRMTAVHEGPPDMMHGGFGAAILDALLGVLVMTEVTSAVTAELTLNYHHPTPIGEIVEVHGWLVEVRPRTIIAAGTISHNGRATISARGVFVPVTMP